MACRPRTSAELGVKWTATTGGDVSARAAVVKGVVYFPDWGGNLWALSAGNGTVLWSRQLSSYGLTGSFTGVYHSRTTPAIDKGTLYLGTQEGGYVLAINASTGDLLWKTQVEPGDPYAIVTTSPAVHNGVVYTGVASIAEAGTFFGINPIPAVRGSAVALNASTGAINWKTYTIPVGYSGGGVWGSNPVVDVARNTLFVSTGNNSGILMPAPNRALWASPTGRASRAAAPPRRAIRPTTTWTRYWHSTSRREQSSGRRS